MAPLKIALALGILSSCISAGRTVQRQPGQETPQKPLPPQAPADPKDTVRSKLYPQDWKPLKAVAGPNGETWELEDYSYAGYNQSESGLPDLKSWKKYDIKVPPQTSQGGGPIDLAPFLIKALQEIRNKNEFYVLQVPQGRFTLGQDVAIDRSKTALVGQGPERTQLIIDPSRGSLFIGSPKGSRFTKEEWRIVRPLGRGEKFFEVAKSDGLNPGDEILIKWTLTKEFAEEKKSVEWWGSKNAKQIGVGGQVENFRRVIQKIDKNRIFFDAPLPMALSLREKPQLNKYISVTRNGALQDLSVSSSLATTAEAWSAPSKRLSPVVNVVYCRDCWVKNIRSFANGPATEHLAGHGLRIDQSLRITVENVHLGPSQHLGPGGNGYLFMVGQVNHLLVKDAKGRGGRHNLTFLGFWGSSQNVVTGFLSENGRICQKVAEMTNGGCTTGHIDTHHPLAISNLIENSVVNDGIYLGNRQFKSEDVGQTATQSVLWGISGRGEIYSYNMGKGYVIGTGPDIEVFTEVSGGAFSSPTDVADLIDEAQYLTEPADYTEHLGITQKLFPPSLFYDQLRRRKDSRQTAR